MSASIRVEHGALHRGDARVLAPAAFALPRGATVGLVGANGVGKSTLVLGLADVLETPGAVDLRLPGGARPRVRHLPQQVALPGWATGREVALAYGVEPAALRDAHPQFGTEALLRARVGELSGGQRQLFALLLTLAAEADLYLLDEPLSALDMLRRRQVLALLGARGAAAPGAVTVVSSHVAADLYEVCDHFVVLRDGEVVFTGSRAEMLSGEASGEERVAFEERILALLE